jgi:hypothetical protein
VFLQQVAEGFVSQFLKVLHPVAGQEVEGLPRFIVELHSLAGHQRATVRSW